jgi:F-type H+-transporting ATPase subunit a
LRHPPTIFELGAGALENWGHVQTWARALFQDEGHAIALQALLTCTLIVLILGGLVRRGLARDDGVVPSERFTLRNFLEVMLEGLVGLMRDVIGPDWRRYAPLIGTLGLFILVSNLMGLVPGLTGPTSFIETNLSWAIVSFSVYQYVAIRHHGASYIKHFLGPVPWLAPLMFFVEVVSHLARILSLTIRLTANMFADHTLVALFLSFGLGVNFVIPWLFMGLGLFVAFLQAFIFSFLTMIYIGGALEEAH